MSKRFIRSQYRNLKPATEIPGMPLKNGHRLEVAEHFETGVQVFVLDRREIISPEDGFALGSGKDRISSTRRR